MRLLICNAQSGGGGSTCAIIYTMVRKWKIRVENEC